MTDLFTDYRPPNPPQNAPEIATLNQAHKALRWLLCVLDDDSKHLSFVAQTLSHKLRYRELSDRQLKGVDKVYQLTLMQFHGFQLDCQQESGS